LTIHRLSETRLFLKIMLRLFSTWLLNEKPGEATRRPPPEAASLLILRPCLLTAIAFEHTDGAAGLRIQHRPKQRRLLIAVATGLDRIGGVAGKDFVLKLVIHGSVCLPFSASLSTKVNSCS